MDIMEISYEIERNGCRLGATASLDPGEGMVESYGKLQRMVEREHARFAPSSPQQLQQAWMMPRTPESLETTRAEWVEKTLGTGVYKLGNHLCCKVNGGAAVVRCSGTDGAVIALTELIVQAQALLCDLKKTA